MLSRVVIIAAGGTGSRLNANLPKQYMLLNSKPVLMHTIQAFENHVDKIVVAIHADMVDYWNELCQENQFNIPHELVLGGKTRFQSIRNAINYLETRFPDFFFNEDSTIAIHDAARPLVDSDLIEKSFALAFEGKSNVLANKSTNSIRIGSINENDAVDRDTVWQIQTPQTFPAQVLLEAYQQLELPTFTDDASVVEKIGYSIHLIESSHKNLKLTFPEDFEIAKLYLNTK
ncbi:2-C-methyl-D-erythritol 4-phosphate cytidylyltransferase [Sphingobacterium litopenaei]|uniref:2-C-methyl-D-erythritol 4-phosphate cytidylyltransferase n=1 Tax=Sphingobacterium litopenaei TaxID=2763500 RepID=A0ABR7YA95_9SPHI|nr:2-C-methyl-D-erythritol 4-phosphate cytidylyltransferase [Sphingobacterium litopenaei]MBD1428158.1 2-C-methyl-D-erythritol 4-phosphate cytidylyltransferase [Sphingobacterium litopenaei]